MNPVVFIGHGNPMNALRDNAFTRALARLGAELPRPEAILCVSAHWMTRGAWATHMARPRTIHDFYGFPQELFDIQYPAPGSPETAEASAAALDDSEWGLDHGAWSVLRHMYPAADIPVAQFSLDMEKPPEYHFEMGRTLRRLRGEGVLILGSGNIVHNLRRADFADDAAPFDWAVEFDTWVKEKLEAGDYAALVHHARDTEAGRLAIPTLEHWLPLLYVLGAAEAGEPLKFIYEGIENASISMRCFRLG